MLGFAVIKKRYGLGPVSWNFFAPNHGANAYDGAAAQSKKLFTNTELNGRIIKDITELVFLCNKLTNHAAIELKVQKYQLPEKIPTEEGIRKSIFCFVYLADGSISCFATTGDALKTPNEPIKQASLKQFQEFQEGFDKKEAQKPEIVDGQKGCVCKSGCKTKHCSCKKMDGVVGRFCNSSCRCTNCQNKRSE